jgi:hypothetical protein
LGFGFLDCQALNLHTIKALTLLFLSMSLRSQAKSGKKDILLLVNPDFFWKCHVRNSLTIRALSAHSAAEINILPSRWQHVWVVAIVPPERWGKMDRNDCHTA